MAGRAAALNLTLLLLAAAPAAAQRTPVALRADAAASRIYVVTHRTGLLSFLGHEHAILAQKWSADLCWDPDRHAASRAVLLVDARALEIDADSARQLAVLGKGPSAQQRTQIHQKLHAEKGLATESYPELRFETTSVSDAGGGKLQLRGRLTIKGATRDVVIPVTVEPRSGDELLFSGALRFRQTEFGIRPESIAGVVKVADPVDLFVRIVARPTGNPCSS